MKLTINDKLIYSNSVFFEVEKLDNYNYDLENKSNIEPGIVYANEVPGNLQKQDVSGDLLVHVGDHVEKGQKLVDKKNALSKNIKSKYSGVVYAIEKDQITIMPDGQEKLGEIINDFQVTLRIANQDDNSILFQFPSYVLNLFESKGVSDYGQIMYVSENELKDKKKLDDDFKDKIILTEKLGRGNYEMLATLGAKGVLTNTIDYYYYHEIRLFRMPFGLISGFGDLKVNDVLFEYLQSFENQDIILDSKYRRLLLPSKSPSHLVEDFVFEIDIR